MTQMHALPDSRDTSARPSVHLVSGDLFASEDDAHAWVKKLDEMNNEQLADVLGFIFCKLCKR